MTTFRLQQLAVEDRPRERLFGLGVEYLSTLELLQLILNPGIAGQSIISTVQQLVSQFQNLDDLCQATPEQLMQIKGIGRAKSSQLKASLELAQRLNSQTFRSVHKKLTRPADVYQLIKRQLRDYYREHFYVIILNVANVAIHQVSIGILDMALVHPREVFSQAIINHASAIIVAHNHPSGNLTPSSADILLTKRLQQAGLLLGISVKDHIIINKESYLSFKDQGLL